MVEVTEGRDQSSDWSTNKYNMFMSYEYLICFLNKFTVIYITFYTFYSTDLAKIFNAVFIAKSD